MGFGADFFLQGISVNFSLFIFGKLVNVWIFLFGFAPQQVWDQTGLLEMGFQGKVSLVSVKTGLCSSCNVGFLPS